MNRRRALGMLVAVSLELAGSSALALTLSAEDVDALGRVAIAEAGNQGDAGMAAVIDVILHRAEMSGFAAGVQGVVDAPRQFEAVSRAGGSWRRLPLPSAEQRTRIATILSLKAAGVMGDVSQGGLFFQNEAIVRERARQGAVSPSLVGFGGLPVTVRIGDHTFYRPAGMTVGPGQSERVSVASEAPGNASVRDGYVAAVRDALGDGELPE